MRPTLGHLNESSPRAEAWRAVFGGLDVPVKSPIPSKAILPVGLSYVYQVALDKLTPDARRRLVDYLASRFALPREEVDAGLEKEGCPILCEDVSVSFDPRLVM